MPGPQADLALAEDIRAAAVEACTYHEAWRGECGDPTVQAEPPRCDDHAGKTCRVCGDPASHGCPATFGLVCGAPLCDDHGSGDCPVHPR